MRIREAALLLAVSASALGQSVPVTAPTPLTNTRYGAAGLPAEASIASNGRTFVAAWTAGGLVRAGRVNPDGTVGIGIPVAIGRDRPAIAAVGDGYVVAMTGIENSAEIRLRFLDENGRPVAPETAPVGYGFKPLLVSNGSLIALFYGDNYYGRHTAVLFDHDGNERLRRSVSPPEIFHVADFSAATNGVSFEIILSNGHDVFVESLDGAGNIGPLITAQTAEARNGLLVEVAIASNGRGYLAAWNTADGKLSAATISDAGSLGTPAIVAAPSAGLEVRRPRLAWNGTQYAGAYLDGGGHDYNAVFGTPRLLEIDAQSMTAMPRTVIAPESIDVTVAAAPDRWLATWTERRDFIHYEFALGRGGALRGAFIGDAIEEPHAITLAASEEWMPAAATNGASTLVTWLEATSDSTSLMAGLLGADRSWRELGALALINKVPQSIVAASDGTNFLLVWDTSALRINSSGTPLDAAPLTVPFPATGAAWDGRAYVLVGKPATDTTLVATTISPSGIIGTVRQIRPKVSTDTPGGARIASNGDGALVTFVRTYFGFPIFPTTAGAIALDRDLVPRGQELALVSDGISDTAVAWNGSEYLAVVCRNYTVVSSRLSRDGALLDAAPRIIHDHGYGNAPFDPSLVATGSGYIVAWRLRDWSRRPLSWGFLATLRVDGTPSSAITRFESQLASGPLLLTRGGQTDLIASAFRTAVPFYGASRIEAFHIGDLPSAPLPPRLIAFPSGANFVLEWTAVGGAAGYRMQYRIGGDDWQEMETWFAPSQTRFTLTVLNSPTLYQFRLRALGTGGPSQYSNEVRLSRGRQHAVR